MISHEPTHAVRIEPVGVAVILYTRIREIPVSNLDRDTGYTDRFVF
jgi:hypothetical protein